MTKSTRRVLSLGSLVALLSLAMPSSSDAQEALSVASVTMGTALENGQPTEPKTTFAQNEGRLYVVVQLQNPAAAETQVRIMIRQAGGSGRGGVTLEIPARRRYRTLARFTTRQTPGNYEAVVLNAEGVEISTTAFTITA